MVCTSSSSLSAQVWSVSCQTKSIKPTLIIRNHQQSHQPISKRQATAKLAKNVRYEHLIAYDKVLKKQKMKEKSVTKKKSRDKK